VSRVYVFCFLELSEPIEAVNMGKRKPGMFTSAPFLYVGLPIHTLYFTLLLRRRHNNTIPAIRTIATTNNAPKEFKG
jgi:hypothetical protein